MGTALRITREVRSSGVTALTGAVVSTRRVSYGDWQNAACLAAAITGEFRLGCTVCRAKTVIEPTCGLGLFSWLHPREFPHEAQLRGPCL
jgi:hypothetical protein